MSEQIQDKKKPKRVRRVKKVKISMGSGKLQEHIISFECEETITQESHLDIINYVDVRHTSIGTFPQLQNLKSPEPAENYFFIESTSDVVRLEIQALVARGINSTSISIYYNDGLEPVVETYLVDLESN